MISTHVYSAFLIGSPDRELSLRGGSITLDDTSAPHVQGHIEIAWPGHWEVVPDDLPTAFGGPVWVRDDDVLDALNPNLSTPRVRVEVDGTYPSFSAHREFDLGIRDRVPDQVSRVVQLEIASDEALADDYAPLVDDAGPFSLAGSLRAVVNYALGEAIPGAALASIPAIDADVTPYWSLTNLITNPSAEVNTTGWAAGTGTSAISRITGAVPPTVSGTASFRWTAAAAGQAFLSQTSAMPVTAGRSYVFSGYFLGTTTLRQVQPMIRFSTAAGETLKDLYGPSALASTSEWKRFVQVVEAPAGATQATVHIRSVTNAAGQFHYADGLMFHEGTRAVPYFDGGTADDTHYTYDFSGDVAHASPSVRTPLIERDPDSLIWPAGVSALEFLRPLVQAAGFRLVCDETRTWTLRDENYVAEGSMNVRYGVNLIDGSEAIRRDSGLWFDAQVTVYRWTDRDGIRRQALDPYALTDPPTRVNRVEIEAPYPGPGRSEYAVRRAQGRGREVDASAVARWTERAEQPITVVLDGAPIQYGKTSRVTFDLGPGDTRDRVSVTTRTTDIDPDAWLLGDDTEDWMTGDLLETWL